MKILLLLSFAAIAALAATGCTSTCTHVCEQQTKCEGATPRACSYDCESSEHIADHLDCRTTFEAYQTCADKPAMGNYCGDVPATRCTTEYDAFVACRNTFCATHTGDAACSALAL